MAEIKSQGEPALPAKRKPDLNCVDKEDYAKKNQKLETFGNNSSVAEEKIEGKEEHPNKSRTPDSSDHNTSICDEKRNKEEEEEAGLDAEEDDDEDGEEDYEDEEEDDDDDGDGEELNGKAEVDRKGKGILRDDKGKGKLIEEDDDSDDDDDSSDNGNQSDGDDSDLSDDPLAEVDLDNILPSRTRRRVVQPGVYIANDTGNNDDDDSDDADA